MERQLTNAIRNLLPNDFQFFCGLFLSDSGYAYNSETERYGKRDKGRDFWGTYGSITFEAHCKGYDNSGTTRTALREAILVAGKHHQETTISPPQRIILFCQSPIYPLKGVDNNVGDCDKTKEWIGKIIYRLKELYTCYTNIIPEFVIYHPERMSSSINMEKYRFNSVIRFLNKMGVRENQQPDYLFFDDDYEEEFRELEDRIDNLKKYIVGLNYITSEMTEEVYDSLLEKVINLMGGNFIIAANISKIIDVQLNDKSSLFYNSLHLYCRILRDEDIIDDDLIGLIYGIVERENRSDKLTCHGFRLCLTRILRNLFYSKQQIIDDVKFANILKELYNSSPYWAKFCADIYFRALISSIEISDETFMILHVLYCQYQELFPYSVLSKISIWIRNPIEICLSNKKDALLNNAFEIASQIIDVIDLKWLFIGLSRVLSLYDPEEEEEEFAISDLDIFIEKVLRKLPVELRESTPYIPYLLLRSKLFILNRKSTIRGFNEFENQFAHYKNHIHYRQLREIQINYAGCLINFLQKVADKDVQVPMKDLSLLGSSTLFPLKESRKAPDPIKSRMFSFPGVEYLAIRPPFSNRNLINVISWLGEYALQGFNVNFKSKIKKNHSQSLLMGPARKVESIRRTIHTLLVARLELLSKEHFPLTPISAANSLRVFEKVVNHHNINIMPELVKLALKAPKYELLRASRGIWHILYLLDRYGQETIDDYIIKELINEAYNLTRPGEPGTTTISWAYAGAILLRHQDNIESRFINEFFHIFMTRHISDTYESGITAQHLAIFGTTEMELFIEWASSKSLIATSLHKDCQNPEIWNLLGTSQLDYIHNDIPELILKRAIECYRLALWFSRDNPQIQNPKYGFNFIDRISQLYLINDTIPSERDIKECYLFLRTRSAKSFHYNKDRSKQFFLLLDQNWIHFTESTKKIIKTIIKLGWIKEMITASNEFPYLIKAL